MSAMSTDPQQLKCKESTAHQGFCTNTALALRSALLQVMRMDFTHWGGAIHEASAVLQASLCCAEGPPSPSGRQRLVLLPLRAGTIALTAAACAAPSQCQSLPPLGTPPHWPSMPRCMEPPELLLQVLTLLTAAVCAMMTLNIQRRFCLCCDISYQTMLLLCVY